MLFLGTLNEPPFSGGPFPYVNFSLLPIGYPFYIFYVDPPPLPRLPLPRLIPSGTVLIAPPPHTPDPFPLLRTDL